MPRVEACKVCQVAVRLDGCRVERPRRIEDESILDQSRRVELESDRCVVAARR